MMQRRCNYDDGLDADGYPIETESWRKPFIHGDESDAGDWQPTRLVTATADAIERIGRIWELSHSTDSPIETRIGAAVLMLFERLRLPLKLAKMIDLEKTPDQLLLVPQFAWSYYRSDWAILNPKRAGALLIECDGKEFHSSVDQIAHDNRKDAAAHDRGFLTMRFTGSEIHRDADGCAMKIFDAVCGL